MLVTELGILKEVSCLPIAYCTKVFLSLVYRLPSIEVYFTFPLSTFICFSWVQLAHIPSPMLVTELGIVMLWRDLQSSNA